MVYSVAAIRKIERYCIDYLGITENQLMLRAGQQAWEVLCTTWQHAKHITIFCGPGNNGGDGYILARLALEQHYKVNVYTVSGKAGRTKAAMHAYQQYLDAGGSILVWQNSLIPTDVIVDALFGIGLQRPIEGTYVQMVRMANAHNVPILALDIPSGLDADSGKVLGETIHADVTATFIAEKIGLLKALGYVGKIVCCDLKLPPQAYAAVLSNYN